MSLRASSLLIALGALLAVAGCGETSAQTAEGDDTPPAGDTAPPASAPATVVYARVPSESPAIQSMPVMPQPSPHASVEQTVGVAVVHVDYSSPAVHEREIWGGLLPYGQLWRAGANAATRVELTEPSRIFDTDVPAGAYSLFVIPNEGEWTVILNRDSSGRGYSGHDPAEDVVRGSVTPADAPPRERLAYLFEDTTESSTTLVLDWAGKRLPIPITFDTPGLVRARIDGVLAQAWRPHFNAGRYLLEQEGHEAEAVELLTRSQQIQATWWNEWFLARALAATDRQADAIEHAEHALELGAGDTVFEGNFAAQVRSSLEQWR